MRIALGLALALTIGSICRVAGVPLPAPPVLIGATLVVAMSSGYVLADRFARHREAKHRGLCGGPSGERVRSTGSPT
jgi:XapX domain-containing protein